MMMIIVDDEDVDNDHYQWTWTGRRPRWCRRAWTPTSAAPPRCPSTAVRGSPQSPDDNDQDENDNDDEEPHSKSEATRAGLIEKREKVVGVRTDVACRKLEIDHVQVKNAVLDGCHTDKQDYKNLIIKMIITIVGR